MVGQTDSVMEMIQCGTTTFFGVYALSCTLQGYLLEKLSIWQRVVFGIAGITLMTPETYTDIFGAICFVIICVVHVIIAKRNKLKNT